MASLLNLLVILVISREAATQRILGLTDFTRANDTNIVNAQESPSVPRPSRTVPVNFQDSFLISRILRGEPEAFNNLNQLRHSVEIPGAMRRNWFLQMQQPNVRRNFLEFLHNVAVSRGLVPNSHAFVFARLNNGLRNVHMPVQPNTQVGQRLSLQQNDFTDEDLRRRQEIRQRILGAFNRNQNDSNSNLTRNSIVGQLDNASDQRQDETIMLMNNHHETFPNGLVNEKSVRNKAWLNNLSYGSTTTEALPLQEDVVLHKPSAFHQSPALHKLGLDPPLIMKEIRENNLKHDDHSITVKPSQYYNAIHYPYETTTFTSTTDSPTTTSSIRTTYPPWTTHRPKSTNTPTSTYPPSTTDLPSTTKSTVPVPRLVPIYNKELNEQDGFYLKMPKVLRITSNNMVVMDAGDSDRLVPVNIDTSHNVPLLIPKSYTETYTPIDNDSKYTLQEVGEVDMESRETLYQHVGHMNLTFSTPYIAIKKIGAGTQRERKFLMKAIASEDDDSSKFQLQKLGPTNMVPGEVVRLHGNGSRRLLTREKVVLEKVGFVQFDQLNDTLEPVEEDVVLPLLRVQTLDNNIHNDNITNVRSDTVLEKNVTNLQQGLLEDVNSSTIDFKDSLSIHENTTSDTEDTRSKHAETRVHTEDTKLDTIGNSSGSSKTRIDYEKLSTIHSNWPPIKARFDTEDLKVDTFDSRLPPFKPRVDMETAIIDTIVSTLPPIKPLVVTDNTKVDTIDSGWPPIKPRVITENTITDTIDSTLPPIEPRAVTVNTKIDTIDSRWPPIKQRAERENTKIDTIRPPSNMHVENTKLDSRKASDKTGISKWNIELNNASSSSNSTKAVKESQLSKPMYQDTGTEVQNVKLVNPLQAVLASRHNDQSVRALPKSNVVQSPLDLSRSTWRIFSIFEK